MKIIFITLFLILTFVNSEVIQLDPYKIYGKSICTDCSDIVIIS